MVFGYCGWVWYCMCVECVADSEFYVSEHEHKSATVWTKAFIKSCVYVISIFVITNFHNNIIIYFKHKFSSLYFLFSNISRIIYI